VRWRSWGPLFEQQQQVTLLHSIYGLTLVYPIQINCEQRDLTGPLKPVFRVYGAMDQRTRKPPPDPEDRFLFADLRILAFLERSFMGGPSIEYFQTDVTRFYKEHCQRAISVNEIESKLQSFWGRWHASGDNPAGWKKIYNLGLKGLPRLAEEQKDWVRETARGLKDGTIGTPRRTRSDSTLPRALLSPAKTPSRNPVTSPSSSRVRKSRKYDGSPKRKARGETTVLAVSSNVSCYLTW
jgi:hypothetical protein